MCLSFQLGQYICVHAFFCLGGRIDRSHGQWLQRINPGNLGGVNLLDPTRTLTWHLRSFLGYIGVHSSTVLDIFRPLCLYTEYLKVGVTVVRGNAENSFLSFVVVACYQSKKIVQQRFKHLYSKLLQGKSVFKYRCIELFTAN